MANGTSAVSLARIPLQDIVPDPSQPRRDFDPHSLGRLEASIQERGLKNPIRVHWEASLGKYMILSGERRYRAAKQAALATIDCVIVERGLSDADRLEEQLTENLLREDLNPIEKALGIRALMNAQNWNQKKLAEYLKVDTSNVTRSLALLALPDKIQKLVEHGTLAPRTAYEITKLRRPDDQLEVANMVVNKELDATSTERIVRLKNGEALTRKGGAGPKGKRHSENRALPEQERQAEAAGGSFPFLLNQFDHPSGHVTSVLKGDRADVTLKEQIHTLQAHIVLLKRACKDKRSV